MIPHSKPWITDDDRKAIEIVLKTGMISQGEEVKRFERMCAQYLGSAHAVATASGTAALVLALRALELEKGAEVVVPTYVCKSVGEAVLTAGLRPVLCDSGPSWNMTVETVAEKITSETGAIVLVDIFGIPVDAETFVTTFGLPVIEDACQAFGAESRDRKVGTAGAVGIFSFHGTKCLTTGEGGLAVTNSRVLSERMRLLRDGTFQLAGRITAPLSDIQAALGLSQLSRYEDFLKRRARISQWYFDALADTSAQLPHSIREESIFFRFPLRTKGEFTFYKKVFSETGVEVRQGVDSLLHTYDPSVHSSFPQADRAFKETLCLPIYPALTDGEVEQIVEASRSVFRA